MRSKTFRKRIASTVRESAKRLNGPGHFADILEELPVEAKDQANKKALIRELKAIDKHVSAESRRLVAIAKSIERLSVDQQ